MGRMEDKGKVRVVQVRLSGDDVLWGDLGAYLGLPENVELDTSKVVRMALREYLAKEKAKRGGKWERVDEPREAVA